MEDKQKSLISGLFSPMGLKILLIAGIIAAIAGATYLIYKNWDRIKAWWDSWTLKDVFAPVIGFAQKAWVCVGRSEMTSRYSGTRGCLLMCLRS